MNILTRLQGIFIAPQQTLKALSDKPIWVDAVIVFLIASALFSYFIAPYAQKDSIEAFENNIKLQERLGKDRFNDMMDRMKNPSSTGIILRSFLLSPFTLLLGLLFSSLVILVMGRLISTEGKYVQIFAALLHVSFIDKLLGNGIRLILILGRQSVMQTTTSLALFFPTLEVASPAFVILSQFDFFQIWLFGVLGFGLSFIFKVELRKALFVSYGFWLLKSLVYIGFGLLSLQFMT